MTALPSYSWSARKHSLDLPYTYNNILIPHPDAESPGKITVWEQGIPDQVRDEDFFSLFWDTEWNSKTGA